MCSHMSHRDIYLLSLTSKSMNRLLRQRVAQKQNVELKISSFVKQTNEFWSLLRRSQGLIVGEFARTFFTGGACQVFDLAFVEKTGADRRGLQDIEEMVTVTDGYSSISPMLRPMGCVNVWTIKSNVDVKRTLTNGRSPASRVKTETS